MMSFDLSGYHSKLSSIRLFFVIRMSLRRTVFAETPTSVATSETALRESSLSDRMIL